jgi:site-specific DNA-methyltransferase (adenine-specific)
MKVINKLLTELKPYEKNPRINDAAVGPVAESIKQFGFRVPLVIDSEGVIICGHTRYKAAEMLGLDKVPCVVADDLTPEKIKAFRLADNKTGELASWDFALLADELEELDAFDFDMPAFGFEDPEAIDWADVDDLKEETYKEPEKTKLKCPHCGHVDSKERFQKA